LLQWNSGLAYFEADQSTHIPGTATFLNRWGINVNSIANDNKIDKAIAMASDNRIQSMKVLNKYDKEELVPKMHIDGRTLISLEN
jgi:hypothetical protein